MREEPDNLRYQDKQAKGNGKVCLLGRIKRFLSRLIRLPQKAGLLRGVSTFFFVLSLAVAMFAAKNISAQGVTIPLGSQINVIGGTLGVAGDVTIEGNQP